MKSYSQSGQDTWVTAMTEGMRDAFFLDIGCNHPTAINNTWLLESEFGWTGILVDILPGCEVRKGRFFQCDAANPTQELRAAYRQMPSVVDFLSLDVDEATLLAFKTLPLDTHRFRVACIEHDTYCRGPATRDAIRTKMFALGYALVGMDVCIRFPDASCPPGSFEDWWADPGLVKSELIQRFTCANKEWSEIVDRKQWIPPV